jgi:demethylmenaquinone methyltransferase/2-methoxy-6-polyprenyl-1,4-benzoquinol methylase
MNINRIFADVSDRYELANHVLTFGLDILWRRRAARIAVRDEVKLCLDVCCGTGEMAELLHRLAGGDSKVVLVDFCLPMLREASRKSHTRDMIPVLGDAGALPFRDETFDLITISFATRNINTSRAALIRCFKEFHRVLKKGGRFINLETSQPHSVLVRWLFHGYVRLFVRRIGRAISGHDTPYRYLSQTIPRFYDADELSGIIGEAGFAKVIHAKMLFGAAAVHEALKL